MAAVMFADQEPYRPTLSGATQGYLTPGLEAFRADPVGVPAPRSPDTASHPTAAITAVPSSVARLGLVLGCPIVQRCRLVLHVFTPARCG